MVLGGRSEERSLGMERIRDGMGDGKGQNTVAGGCYAVCLLNGIPKGV